MTAQEYLDAMRTETEKLAGLFREPDCHPGLATWHMCVRMVMGRITNLYYGKDKA